MLETGYREIYDFVGHGRICGVQTMKLFLTSSAILPFVVVAGSVLLSGIAATDTAGDEPKITVHTVLGGLNNPCGVAIQDRTGHVFVSESGAGRILRVAQDVATPVVTGFPQDVYGTGTYEEGTRFDIGPLGLAFLDRNTLIVGGGGLPDGEDLVRFYTVPTDDSAISVENTKTKSGPIPAGRESTKGEGDFYGVALGNDAVYVTCNGDDAKGWIARLAISNGKPGKLTPFIQTRQATSGYAPTCIVVSGEGYLVVGQMSATTVDGDSRLTFYDAKSKAVLSAFSTGLHDIVALAYSPRRKLLYALQFGWGPNSEAGGLYRLDSDIKDGKQTVQAVKIVSIEKPTAMAFSPNGSLYVTAMGKREADADKKPGTLLRLTGHL